MEVLRGPQGVPRNYVYYILEGVREWELLCVGGRRWALIR